MYKKLADFITKHGCCDLKYYRIIIVPKPGNDDDIIIFKIIKEIFRNLDNKMFKILHKLDEETDKDDLLKVIMDLKIVYIYSNRF